MLSISERKVPLGHEQVLSAFNVLSKAHNIQVVIEHLWHPAGQVAQFPLASSKVPTAQSHLLLASFKTLPVWQVLQTGVPVPKTITHVWQLGSIDWQLVSIHMPLKSVKPVLHGHSPLELRALVSSAQVKQFEAVPEQVPQLLSHFSQVALVEVITKKNPLGQTQLNPSKDKDLAASQAVHLVKLSHSAHWTAHLVHSAPPDSKNPDLHLHWRVADSLVVEVTQVWHVVALVQVKHPVGHF